MAVKNDIINESVFKMDSSTMGMMRDVIAGRMQFDIFSASIEVVAKISVDEVFDYFNSHEVKMNYRVFHGSNTLFYNDEVMVNFRGHLLENSVNKRFDDSIEFTGRKDLVTKLLNEFKEHFNDHIIASHHKVDMVLQGSNGLTRVTLPVKTERKIIPEMYPNISNIKEYIGGFLESSCNILIMIGDAGMGKSALINEIILTARKPTQIVFDVNVMQNDELYTSFINESLNADGGLLIMEDSDTILSDRITERNVNMSRLLNLSDGIVDTSGAKFIFSANIKEKNDIDSALIRPGRCYDVLEFKPLNYDQAITAANAINRELYDHEKNEYTVAEIYNGRANRRDAVRKVGFI